MEKLFKGDSSDMSLGAVIAQSQVGDEVIFSKDALKKWTVSEKSANQMILTNDQTKKASGCENCGGNDFIVFPAWANSYLCKGCGNVTTLDEAQVISKIIINTFVNLSLEKRLCKQFVRAEETEEVVEEATV